ncbi:MAG TPA: type II toxin-antitoxin system HipA family toxin [Candidatus Angelobacter sp.]|jgi:serine/threonine-protein kinase HipA|nr:type II toxin-antitoxin system HipA family toxin [Candidatus Angelobacter sp.]
MNTHSSSLSVLEVWLNQVRVGSITNLPYDQNLFVFDDAYISNPNRPTLSLGFYDAQRNLITAPQQVQTRVPPFFSNLLPEGHLREYLAQRGGVKEVREFFLLWLLGTDLPGAVMIQDAEGRPLPPVETSKKQQRIFDSREGVLRFSLAGVQLKFSAIGHPAKQLSIPVEGRGGYWIVKLPSAVLPKVPENEFSMMKFAKEVGIEVAEAGLVPTNEIEGLPRELATDTSNSLYVKRFDRTSDGSRIHIEDFNQLYGQFPADKYHNFSYGNMAGDIWRILGQQGLVEFVRRLIFTASIGNADMHLKNWSLIYYDGKTPQLAPAYDLVSTIQYPGLDDRLALSIAREKDSMHLDISLLERFAARAKLPGRIVIETALATAERMVKTWPQVADDLPIDKKFKQKINEQFKYVPLTRQFLAGGKTVKSPKNTSRRGRSGRRASDGI